MRRLEIFWTKTPPASVGQSCRFINPCRADEEMELTDALTNGSAWARASNKSFNTGRKLKGSERGKGGIETGGVRSPLAGAGGLFNKSKPTSKRARPFL